MAEEKGRRRPRANRPALDDTVMQSITNTSVALERFYRGMLAAMSTLAAIHPELSPVADAFAWRLRRMRKTVHALNYALVYERWQHAGNLVAAWNNWGQTSRSGFHAMHWQHPSGSGESRMFVEYPGGRQVWYSMDTLEILDVPAEDPRGWISLWEFSGMGGT
jgi:hypothetical protein